MNKFSILLAAGTLLAFTAFVYVSSQNNIATEDHLSHFSEFANKYNKSYSSLNEKVYRAEIFKANLKLINEHNARPNETYTVGVNEFADLTFEEFTAFYLADFSQINAYKTVEKCEEPTIRKTSIPDSVDWQEQNKVQEVKKQLMCGSCWAFSAVASLESAISIKTGDAPLSLSEQELVDCSKDYGNNGCNGGLMNLSFNYVIDHHIHEEAEYPYKGRDGKCRTEELGEGKHGLSQCVRAVPTIDGLMESVAVQPVAAAFHVIQTFMFYRKGVYKSHFCNSEPNHGILVVGYNKTDKNPFFRVKNSWGKGWGENGYFKIAHGTGKGMCRLSGNGNNYYPIA